MRVFFDTAVLDMANLRETRDGYLVASVKAARTGIQDYLGQELGKPELETVRVYRSPEEVFSQDAMASAAHRPLTNDHPPEMVTRDNWKKYAVGQLGGEIARDGDFLQVPLVMMDAGAIADVKSGKRELSMGYGCDIEFTAGTTPQGEAYDAIQKNIQINHLAVVDHARGGSKLRIGDMRGAPDPQPLLPLHHERINDMNLTTVVVDGLSIETTAQGKQVIDRLMASVATLTTAKDAANKALTDATAAHTTAISAKDGEIAGLKSQIPTGTALDKLIADRATLIANAKKVGGDKIVTDGKTGDEIRSAAVAAKLGDAAAKDKDAAYVGAMFDTLLAQGATTPNDVVRDTIFSGLTATPDAKKVADAALVKSVEDINAWRTAKTA